MSAISDAKSAVLAALNGVSADLDAISTDVGTLNTNIQNLIANGSLSDDDKASLQAIQDAATALQGKADTAKSNADAAVIAASETPPTAQG